MMHGHMNLKFLLFSLKTVFRYILYVMQHHVLNWQGVWKEAAVSNINPLNAELNPICHLLALLGGATIVVVSRLRVKYHPSNFLGQRKAENLSG